MYYPVEVAGALLSMGDAHMAQGDSELDGTGIETSITGKFKLEVVKAAAFGDMDFSPRLPARRDGDALDRPLVRPCPASFADLQRTSAHGVWCNSYAIDAIHHFLIPAQTETSRRAANPGDIYGASSIDDAMKNYTQTRKFLMAKYGLTDAEVATFITVVASTSRRRSSARRLRPPRHRRDAAARWMQLGRPRRDPQGRSRRRRGPSCSSWPSTYLTDADVCPFFLIGPRPFRTPSFVDSTVDAVAEPVSMLCRPCRPLMLPRRIE